jgi:acyl transferase domain-containing protein
MVEFDAKEKANKSREKFQQFREDVKNRNGEENDHIKIQLEAKQRRLNTDLEAFHQKYTNDTQTKNKEHADYYEKNQKSTKEIDALVAEIDRLKIKIEHMKLKTHQHTKESKKRNEALRKEKNNINNNYQELKAKMTKFRDDETKRLTELAMNSRNAVMTLKDHMTLGERILKTAELCRRLETEREKVLPFYESTVEDEDVPDELKKEFQEISSEKYAEFTYLNNFYKRFNKVQLDKIAIDKQKEQLGKENHILKTMLKQYLDGISLNDEVLKSVNPLLDVNYKLDVKRLPIEKMAPSDTHIEATKVYNHYQKQNV